MVRDAGIAAENDDPSALAAEVPTLLDYEDRRSLPVSTHLKRERCTPDSDDGRTPGSLVRRDRGSGISRAWYARDARGYVARQRLRCQTQMRHTHPQCRHKLGVPGFTFIRLDGCFNSIGMPADEDDNSRSDAENPSFSEVELLKIAREEAHRTIDHQVDTLNDIDEKAARILRLNLLLLSIILAGLSIAAGEFATNGNLTDGAVTDLWNSYTTLGLISLLASTAMAALTYTASSMRAGMSGRDIEALVDNDATAEQNLQGIVESYSRWMQYNFKINSKNAPLGTLTLLLLIYSIVLLSMGIYHGIINEIHALHLIVIIAILCLITWRTGIIGQLRRYKKYRTFDPSKE